MAQTTPLRRRMLDDMTVRNLSPATQQSYVYAVAKFSRFFDRSPDQLGVAEVRAYQIHLAGLGLSWSHLNQVSCALRFFFGVTLSRQDAFNCIVSAKEPKKLPVVLSTEEITRFLQAVPGLRSRAALTTAYGAGLRGRRLKATRCGMGLYDKLILPRLLDMAMRNEQLTVYREQTIGAARDIARPRPGDELGSPFARSFCNCRSPVDRLTTLKDCDVFSH